MALRTSAVAGFGLLAALASRPAFAVESCSARISQKTGAVLVNAFGVVGTPTWSGSTGTAGIAFADGDTCAVGDRVRRCHLGEPGTLAEMTPPAECRVCVHDDGAPCCAFLKGCTPGPRLRDASFAANDPRVCQGGGATDPACGPVGAWERTNGLVGLGYVLPADLVVLEADGTARVTSREINGALRCTDAIYTKGAGSEIVFDSARSGPRVIRFRLPETDVLELSDADAHTASFVRRDSPPVELTCRTLQVVSRLDGLRLPDFGTGLAFDGTLLWYTAENGEEVSVDPNTGAAGPSLSLPGRVQAAQGPTFWMTDSSATRSEAVRMDFAGVPLDVVTTPGAPGDAPFVLAIAFDAVNDRAFLATTSPTGETHPLLPVLTGVEPDQFQLGQDAGQDLSGLAFDGASLWAMTRSRHMVRVDPASGLARETFITPGDDTAFVAVAAVNGDLFLVGAAFGGQQPPSGAIFRVRQ
jgi:hypothetical protein